MAGDWIKFQVDTPDKPEVLAMANRLGIDSDAVVGKLIRVWSWFDKHTTNGNAQSVTFSLVDRLTNVTGFAEQMQFVGWLEQDGSVLKMTNFDYHTGNSAKSRALGKDRQKKSRESNANSNDESVTETSLEKRREEKNISTPTPKKASPKKNPIPEDFGISERVRSWAIEKNHQHLEDHLENFISSCKANGYSYSDWDSAFMNAIRQNWAKVDNTKKDKSKLAPEWRIG
jgi:hypothetical protein